MAGLVGDALAVGGLAVTGGASAGIVGLSRHLWTRFKAESAVGRTVRQFPGLDQLVADAEVLTTDRESIAELAGRLVFMLNREIESMDVASRPTVVVFVDHMERLQTAGDRHLGEAVLNRLVSRSPWLLFVVTGRNSLGWHRVSDLPASGPRQWPLLSTEEPPLDEPRQHALGFLSPTDARDFLAGSFDRIGILADHGVVDELAAATDGWPLHLQTIVVLAKERQADNRPLTLNDLEGSLPSLVERLMSDLPSDVSEAFRAACLLPYFDVALVAAAGAVPVGAVERLLRRQLHRPNGGSVYPYRIHDTLRALVRNAGSQAAGGWSDSDWRRQAERALSEAERRFDESIGLKDDRAAIDSLALGLNVATEHNLFASWLVDAIRSSPTIQGLAPRLAASLQSNAPSDLVDVVDFLALRARPRGDDVTSGLLRIWRRSTAISYSAGLWRAYDLRGQGRVDEALQQLQDMIDDPDDRVAIYRNQYVTTLRLGRRFREALDLTQFLTPAQQLAQHDALQRAHGHFHASAKAFETRARAAKSRRFEIELLGDLLAIRHRETGVSVEDVDALYSTAVEVGHLSTQAVCLGLRAEVNLFDDFVVEESLAELEDLSRRRGRTFRAVPHVLAMRSLALGDPALANEAHQRATEEQFRSASWIPTEILLERLGHPLGSTSAQWLEPYDEVRDRWEAVFVRIVERAMST